jgi:hypothetical protein
MKKNKEKPIAVAPEVEEAIKALNVTRLQECKSQISATDCLHLLCKQTITPERMGSALTIAKALVEEYGALPKDVFIDLTKRMNNDPNNPICVYLQGAKAGHKLQAPPARLSAFSAVQPTAASRKSNLSTKDCCMITCLALNSILLAGLLAILYLIAKANQPDNSCMPPPGAGPFF